MKNKTLSISFLILTAIIIGLFSYYNIWLGDDVSYAYHCGDKNKHISSLYEIIQSQNVHYFTTNGRYLAHILVQGFCGLWGILPFSIINSLMYILFFLAIFRLSNITLENVKGVASVIILGLLAFQTKMQPSCQIGFVWMFTLTMWLLILFFRSESKKSIWICILCGLIAIIIGNGQEALNLGVCVAFFIYCITNMKKMSAIQYCIMIGFWIGSLTNFLAPGTLNRGSGMAGVSINRLIFSFLSYIIILRAVWVLIFVSLYQKIKHKVKWSEIYKENIFFWNTFFALVLFNIVCHFQSNRVAFGIELMSIIIVMRILPKKAMNYFWLTVAGIMLMINYSLQADYTIKMKKTIATIEKEYAASENGNVYIDINLSSPLSSSRNFSRTVIPYGVNNGGDYTYYEYRCLAKRLSESYPGKPQIKIIPTFLKDKEHEDLGNQLIYTGNHIWLAIQSKSNPAEFFVNRAVPLLPAIKKYDPVQVDMTEAECIIAEGDNWRARFIAEGDHSIHGWNFTSSIEMTPSHK